MPGADKDLVKPLADRLKKQGIEVHLKTKASGVTADAKGITVTFDAAEEGQAPALAQGTFDRVLVAVGRSPNGRKIDAEKAGVQVTDRGFIPVDRQMRTNVPHILPSATSSATRCWPTRPRTRASWPLKWQPATRRSGSPA